MKLVAAEERMIASGSGRDWKALAKLTMFTFLSAAVTFTILMFIALDQTVTSDQLGFFGVGTMAVMTFPILRYRWLQSKKKIKRTL